MRQLKSLKCLLVDLLETTSERPRFLKERVRLTPTILVVISFVEKRKVAAYKLKKIIQITLIKVTTFRGQKIDLGHNSNAIGHLAELTLHVGKMIDAL